MPPDVRALSSRRCLPCEGGVEPLDGPAVQGLLERLGESWRVVDGHHIECEYRFPDFSSALRFVDRVGEIAEQEGHHPEILLGWGRARIVLWTHAVDGLTDNDFILAAKIEKLITDG